MDRHTFNGKRKIGATDISDFTDFQGIGNDPLYKRYSSIRSLIDNTIDPAYADFLAVPDYDASSGMIKWYINDWNETPVRLIDLPAEKRSSYEALKNTTLDHYRKKLNELSGEDLRIMAGVLRYINDDFIYCADGKVFAVAWGMTPDNDKHITTGELIHESPTPTNVNITFESGENGGFTSGETCVVSIPLGSVISEIDIPAPTPKDGFRFNGYAPTPLGLTVNGPMTFKATYAATPPPEIPLPPPPMPNPPKAIVRFDPGIGGILQGPSTIEKPMGAMLLPDEVPVVSANQGYTFTGWNFNPLNTVVNGNMVFQATYKKKKKNWWWWLLLLLLPLLLALVLLFIFGLGFNRCGGVVNGVAPLPVVITERGDTLDDNGYVKPIVIRDHKLPDDNIITAPVVGEGGVMPPIIREPGLPTVIGDRLILFLEDENASLDAFADAFKQAYPQDSYSIIGYDRYVKSLTIQVPDSPAREQLKREINQKIPNFKFLVFDESIYEYHQSRSSAQAPPKGWHLDAVKARDGWSITKGSPTVKVAVVDDGIDNSHDMFKGRIVDPYNVYTQTNTLSKGVGHGTMVAGLAVGSIENAGSGAAGIAPDCSLIPVQVADNNIIPLSSIVSGIMYSVHQGADVINVSIGPQLEGLNMLSIEDQVRVSQTEFLNVARMWDRVCTLASNKNSIIVFAAGNEDILSSIPPENRSASCIVVGAVDDKLYPTQFTNYGFCTDISAPGLGIYSSFPVNSFNSMDGTSFSAPIVSGVVALMRSLDKTVNVAQAKNVLYRTGKDVYGFMPPMVQIPAALQGVKAKDFSRGPERQFHNIPGVTIDPNNPAPMESWVVPVEGNVPGITVIDQGGVRIPVETAIPGGTLPGGVVNPGGTVVNPGGTVPPGNVGTIPGTDIPGVTPANPSNPADPTNTAQPVQREPAQPAEDYSFIRTRIKKLKEEIRELERQLPENQRR